MKKGGHRLEKIQRLYLISLSCILLLALSGTISAVTPQQGGTLRVLRDSGPKVVGYWPEMGPGDAAAVFPGLEFVMTYSADRTMVPQLAERVIDDPDTKSFTIILRKGIQFIDGSELTAEVAAWNYQLLLDNKKLQADVKSIEIIDPFTLRINLNEWGNGLILNLGWIPMMSKEAYEKHGKEWCRKNLVGTGPFILKSIKRDTSMTWVKNKNYWQKDKGLPYLDGIKTLVIPDPVTASAMMQAGSADIWMTPPVQYQKQFKDMNFDLQSGWAGLVWNVIPNTRDPESKWQDKRLREALDYAIDPVSIAKALGYGLYRPIKSVSYEGEWGYDPDLKPRGYDPAKSRKLLAEAGYPEGMKVTLLASMGAGGRNDTAEAVKAHLDEAGFITDLDIADLGRFYGTVFGTGWNDLTLMFTGTGLNFLTGATAWFSHRPKANLASFSRPQTLKRIFESTWLQPTEEGARLGTMAAVDFISEEALIKPLFLIPTAIIKKPFVHTTYPAQGLTRWDTEHTWIDRH